MSLDLILAGATGGMVGAAVVIATQAVTATFITNWTTMAKASWDTASPAAPDAEATAHARLRRFEGGVS